MSNLLKGFLHGASTIVITSCATIHALFNSKLYLNLPEDARAGIIKSLSESVGDLANLAPDAFAEAARKYMSPGNEVLGDWRVISLGFGLVAVTSAATPLLIYFLQSTQERRNISLFKEKVVEILAYQDVYSQDVLRRHQAIRTDLRDAMKEGRTELTLPQLDDLRVILEKDLSGLPSDLAKTKELSEFGRKYDIISETNLQLFKPPYETLFECFSRLEALLLYFSNLASSPEIRELRVELIRTRVDLEELRRSLGRLLPKPGEGAGSSFEPSESEITELGQAASASNMLNSTSLSRFFIN